MSTWSGLCPCQLPSICSWVELFHLRDWAPGSCLECSEILFSFVWQTVQHAFWQQNRKLGELIWIYDIQEAQTVDKYSGEKHNINISVSLQTSSWSPWALGFTTSWRVLIHSLQVWPLASMCRLPFLVFRRPTKNCNECYQFVCLPYLNSSTLLQNSAMT